jgi:Fic family protein
MDFMEDYIYIDQPHEKPNIDMPDLFAKFFKHPDIVQDYVNRISQPRYLFWDKAKYKDSIAGMSSAESWLLAREIRKISSTSIPVRTVEKAYFTWYRLADTDEMLRKIDMYAGGNFLSDNIKNYSDTEQRKYLIRGIMEEAIASSQLEGADTSRKYAKKMLTENIKPRNHSDWMILNNYKVLSRIESEYKNQELSKNMLLDLQASLTMNTVDDNGVVGRLRKDSDDIVVHYRDKIAYEPPKMVFVQEELQRLIDYANDSSRFVHPVIKATVLHFWIGFLHPFPDGNGRTARALFYWYLIKNNYWAFAYLPISTVIKRAPEQYTFAYIYAEQDNLDFTYFYDYIIHRVCLAIDEFKTFVDKLAYSNTEVFGKIDAIFTGLNSRQKQLISYLAESRTNYSTVSSHTKLNGIARQTAHRDLSSMEKQGILVKNKLGRYGKYMLSDTAAEKLEM